MIKDLFFNYIIEYKHTLENLKILQRFPKKRIQVFFMSILTFEKMKLLNFLRSKKIHGKKKKFGNSFAGFAVPLPTVIIGVIHKNEPTYTTLGNFGIMTLNPLTIYISTGEPHYLTQGIKVQSSFSVNIPSPELVIKTDYVGIVSGNKTSKKDVFTTISGDDPSIPIAMECPVNMECRVIKNFSVENMRVFIAEVSQIHINESGLTDGVPDVAKINPLTLFLGKEYREVGKIVGVPYHDGKNYKDYK